MTSPNVPPQRQTPPLISDNSPLIYSGEPSDQEYFDQSPDEYFVNINPISPPAQETLVYAPDVQIFIARGNKQYDVSADIVSVALQRNENAISTLVFKLANKMGDNGKPRYNQLFERMDRVICRMKRTDWYQVFSGYLDVVPHVQLYPGMVTFRASCTLKRILHTWWDPGLVPSTKLMDQRGLNNREEAAGEYSTDTGLGSLLRNFLVEVGGWHPANVHIQRFPESYYTYIMGQIDQTQAATDHNEQEFRKLLLGDDKTIGHFNKASAEAGVHQGSYTTGVLTEPERKMEVLRTVDGMGLGPSVMDINLGQGITGASGRAGDYKDQPAWSASTQVGQKYEEEGKISDAGIHCFMTIMAESSWRMLANAAVEESLQFPHDGMGTDGTSVGLYQQTEANGWGEVSQRMNVRESTEMFLQKLNRIQWRNMDRAIACQTVQGSAFSDGSNYKAWEQQAIQEVRTLRMNQTPGTGGSPTTGNVGTAGGNIPIPPGAVSAVTDKAAAAISSSGTPQALPNAAGTGKPRFDTQGAINYARMQIGKPYVLGTEGPNSFDCSGLVMMAYKSIELKIPRVTNDQLATGDRIPAAQAKPGDLLFPNGTEHVVMVSDVPGMVIHAPHSGAFVEEVPFAAAGVDPLSVPAAHIRGAEWGGSNPAAPFNPFPVMDGYTPGTVANGVNGSISTTSHSEPIARNLFTYMFVMTPADVMSLQFGGQPGMEEKAFMNDQSMMPTVVSLASTGLRKFTSHVNGDFIAYYPDYFGMDGKKAVLTLEDIEMKNVQIDLNDDALCTHAYVSGSQLSQQSNTAIYGWIVTRGFVSVENQWLFKRMTLGAPTVPGEGEPDGKSIMRKFGVRPLIQQMTMLQHGPMEFLAAIQLFMEAWAEQYSTTIELTFMPELFVGNRIELAKHGLSVYVTQVSHSCDWENGFSTTAQVCAPSNNGLARYTDMLRKTVLDQDTENRTDAAVGAQKWVY